MDSGWLAQYRNPESEEGAGIGTSTNFYCREYL